MKINRWSTSPLMKRCSASSVAREMRSKTTVKQPFIPPSTAIIKQTCQLGEDTEKLEPSCTVAATSGKQFAIPQKVNRITI